jgi:hypothetical protein
MTLPSVFIGWHRCNFSATTQLVAAALPEGISGMLTMLRLL